MLTGTRFTVLVQGFVMLAVIASVTILAYASKVPASSVLTILGAGVGFLAAHGAQTIAQGTSTSTTSTTNPARES